MKQVFNKSEVPHIWAQQSQQTGRNSQGNFYFEGATIYSYGRHFPIATIVGNDTVLFTLRTYSNTTTRHIWEARRAISNKLIIECYEIPTSYKLNPSIKDLQDSYIHEKNLNYWKGQISKTFTELGNKRNRDIDGRLNVINRNISELETYCTFFKLKVKDKELKKLLKLVASSDLITKEKEAHEKKEIANREKLKEGSKAYEIYIALWKNFDTEGMQNLPTKTKDLVNFYANNSEAFTRLRFNSDENRLETSKGVQIPAEVAKRAYIQLNGCMEGKCKDIAVPVMNYTITETTDKYIKAGCHTIPKEDVNYIANLLKW